MNGHDGNMAFKCTYNDGGEKGFVGFAGTCTDGNILRNVKTHPRVWCSNPANRCRRFCDREFRGARPQHPCSESRIIEEWRFGPGTYHSGERDGEPIPMYHAQVGKVALLTTRHPERDTEEARIVFGGKCRSCDPAVQNRRILPPLLAVQDKEEGTGSGVENGSVSLSVGSGGEQFPARAKATAEVLSRQDGARRTPGMLREPAGGDG